MLRTFLRPTTITLTAWALAGLAALAALTSLHAQTPPAPRAPQAVWLVEADPLSQEEKLALYCLQGLANRGIQIRKVMRL